MIARHWKGIAKAEMATAYLNHLIKETIPELKKISGFISVSVLKRPVIRGVEFLVATTWDSLEAINQFAGEDIDKAVVPVEVQQMMTGFDKHVSHYEITFESTRDK